MSKVALKPKKAKISRVMIFELICPECDTAIEMSGAEIASTMITAGDWHLVPEIITCQDCGATVARPSDPFKRG